LLEPRCATTRRPRLDMLTFDAVGRGLDKIEAKRRPAWPAEIKRCADALLGGRREVL